VQYAVDSDGNIELTEADQTIVKEALEAHKPRTGST
jgi:hypothetical protein